MRSNRHGYPELTELQATQAVDKFKSGGRRRRKAYPGANSTAGRGMINAIGFPSKRPFLSTTVGWLSQSAVKNAFRFQGGSSVVVTQKMKNYFAMMSRKTGGKVKPITKPVGALINNPARNVIEPTARRLQSKIPAILEKRMLRNIGRISNESYTELLKGILGPRQSLRTATGIGMRAARAA